MADASIVQATKLAIIDFTGLSKDALHVYLGLLVWLLSAALWRKSIATFKPWLVVLVVACGIEAFDAFDDWVELGYWRVGASVHDIVNTLFWPTALALLARFTKLLR